MTDSARIPVKTDGDAIKEYRYTDRHGQEITARLNEHDAKVLDATAVEGGQSTSGVDADNDESLTKKRTARNKSIL